jgi:6-methylsalicylate decarboxylase
MAVQKMHRGGFLAGLAAVGAQCALQASEAAAQTAQRIDVHHHYPAPAWEAALLARNAYGSVWKGWSPQVAIDALDRGGVQKGLLSVTTPGTWFGDDAAARRLARECNEFAATVIAQHRGRFGMFVALPLPDVTGSLDEIAYGLDTLRADGVGLFTSYGGKYLGDPAFDPVFAELDRRRTVVFVHPTDPMCCTNVLAAIPEPVIEFGTDTTRAIANVIFSGTSARYPNLRLIFCHAGGTMPFLIERFVNLAAHDTRYKTSLPNGFLPEARRFYYDTAQTTMAAPLEALLKVIPISHVVFGSDFPFMTIAENVEGLQTCGLFSARDLSAIGQENAVALFKLR